MHRAPGFAVLVSVLALSCQRPRLVDPPRPKLVVLIVVDQLPTWSFEHGRQYFTGGFARLLREGALVAAAELPYASPFTAVGHASIGTGAPPATHGVFGNSWYRRDRGHDMPAETDLDAAVFTVAPSLGGELSRDDQASGRALRVDGLADTLRSATGGRAHSLTIAMKARAAVFMAGKRPDLAVWFEAAAGGMTTSSAYTPAAPPWLVQHAATQSPRGFFDAMWRPRDPALLARITGAPDSGPGEGAVHGFTQAFPHSLATSTAPQQAFLHTPYGDEVVLATAFAALDAMPLGADGTPDLLAIGFSAQDFVGHLWGPTSWEAVEVTLELDRKLDRLFTELDRRFGRDGWAAVLTSDHGATPIVERSFTIGSRRIRSEEITKLVDAAFVARAGAPVAATSWVAKVVASSVYLTAEATALPPAVFEAALDDAAARLSRLDNIAIAGRVDQIRGDCHRRTGLPRAVCLSQVPGESGELYVMPVAGSLITDHRSGTHHDAPFDDNRRVPILVRAPGLRPQRGTGTLLQVAPTVAALLGIPAPPGATEPALFELATRAAAR